MWKICAFYLSFHRMGGEHFFVLPPHRLPGGEGLGNIQQTLVPAAPEAEGDVVLSLHEAAIHQHIQQTQQLVGDFAPRVAGDFAGQLLPGVAGVAPDRFLRVKGFEILHKGHQLPLVLRLHRLAAQQGEARDIVRLAGGEHLVADGLVEGLAIAEIPCHLIEAAGAVVAAAGNEDAGADARPVGDVVIFNSRVVHKSDLKAEHAALPCNFFVLG